MIVSRELLRSWASLRKWLTTSGGSFDGFAMATLRTREQPWLRVRLYVFQFARGDPSEAGIVKNKGRARAQMPTREDRAGETERDDVQTAAEAVFHSSLNGTPEGVPRNEGNCISRLEQCAKKSSV